MLVRTLSAWAGPHFSFAYGEIINLADDVAKARIEAGLAEPAPKGALTGQVVPDVPPYHQAAIDEQADRLAQAADGSHKAKPDAKPAAVKPVPKK